MVTLALLFRPSTMPLEISFRALGIIEDEFTMLTEGAGDFLHRRGSPILVREGFPARRASSRM